MPRCREIPQDGEEAATADEDPRVSVLLPHRLGLLTYRAAGSVPAPGALVRVPLGRRTLHGVVWDDPPDETIVAAKLKPVEEIGGPIAIGEELRRFVDFVGRYTMAERGAVLRMVLRAPDALAPPKRVRALEAAEADTQRLTPARARVLQTLNDGPMTRAALAEASGASPAVVAAMVRAGLLREVVLDPPAPPRPDPDAAPPALGAEQAAAAGALRESVAAARFHPVLLDGVTGSGKTEVYLEAVAQALAQGRQALVLMPEIALTPMVVARIAQRFGAAPGEWHSGRTPAARAALWRGVATGDVSVVVAARSGLFLPFRALGVIVVDEEHEQSYKQEDGVAYHARDMAIVRAKTAGVPVVLVSATASVETRINAARGRYGHLTLPSRHGGAPLPAVRTVDLRTDPPPRGAWLAPPVREAVEEALARGEQTLLFLNRRGYAPLTVCRRCGHRMTCPNCTASLVEHRLRARLLCHHCGHEAPRPAACPSCAATDTLAACGPGVERVAEEAAQIWPHARCLTLSSDLSGGPPAIAEALGRVSRGEVDIVVGTQLVAKGHTFPGLQLVVVVDADLGLDNADPRAAERTFQLLTQVAGRAGRVAGGGRALLQTHAPDHPVIEAMARGDADAFYREETEIRQSGGLPPFRRLAAIIVSAGQRAEAHAHAAALARTAPAGEEIEVLGPAEAPLAILRGRYRYRLLVRAPRRAPLQAVMAGWLGGVPVTGSVRRAVDIDPQSFL